MPGAVDLRDAGAPLMITPRSVRVPAFALLLIVEGALLRLDPYSSGGRGGVSFETIGWQLAVTAVLYVLLIAAILGGTAGRYRLAQTAAWIEGLVFLFTNLIYLGRDGIGRFAPMDHRPQPALVLLLAIIFRLLSLVTVRRLRADQPGV